MLHIVTSKYHLTDFEKHVSEGDDVVFMGDGVFCRCVLHDCQMFAVLDHVKSRGVCLKDSIKLINMKEFLDLVVSNSSSVTWG